MFAEYLDLSSESDSDSKLETLLLLYRKSRKVKLWKSEYMKKRGTHGEFALTREFSNERFLNYFRVNREEFEEVHSMIQPIIYSEGCNAQTPIGTEEKLAVFVRYLASGDSNKSIGYSYRTGDRTVANTVNEVSIAIWRNMQQLYLPQPTREMWISIASDFETRWHFHTPWESWMESMLLSKSLINLDPHSLIINTISPSFSWQLSKHTTNSFSLTQDPWDDSVTEVFFSSSQLGRKLDKGTLKLPPPADLPSFEHALPYVFVGDEAFPVMPNLMRPYPRRRVMGSYENEVFNYGLSRATQHTLLLRLIPCSETI